MIVGITGLIGSGKSMIGGFFRDLGIYVEDADYIAHIEINSPDRLLVAISAHTAQYSDTMDLCIHQQMFFSVVDSSFNEM